MRNLINYRIKSKKGKDINAFFQKIIYVIGVRKIEKAMGNGEKKIIEAEKIIAKKLRGHLF